MKRKRNDAITPYAVFSRYYDAYASICDLEKWYGYLREIKDKYARCACGILDLGCGTGSMALMFARGGYAVTGVDISCDMLSLADAKAHDEERPLRLLRGDIAAFRAAEKFSFIYSICDSVNYLDSEHLTSFLKNTYDMLIDGGVLTFDFINARARTIRREKYRLDQKIILRFKRSRTESILTTQIMIRDGETLFAEKHRQYMYVPEEIIEKAEDAGFDICGMFEMLTFENSKMNSRKVQAVLLKNIK